MSICLFLAAALAGGAFSAAPLDGGARIVLSSTRPVAESANVRCRWTVYKDALPAASGLWPVARLGVGSPITNVAPAAVQLRARGGDLALRVRFVTGDEDPRKEKLLAVSQIDYPRANVRPLSAFTGKPAELKETAETYEFILPSSRIRFDRGTGLICGFATGWWSSTEWFARPMAFDFGDPVPKVRMETFTQPTETNGVWRFKTVSWWTMSSDAEGLRVPEDAVSHRVRKKNFELRVTTDWQVRGDGRVVSLSKIRPFGLRHVLPRVGWAFVLAPPDPLVQYFGAGPARESKDRSLEGLDGLFLSSAAGCGSHERTRAVAFDAGSDHFAISTLGGDFFLEVGATPSKKTFCGIVAERNAETDHDWQLNLLISPEKTLKALTPPE